MSAFDKVDHSIWFQKLINRRCPAKFVRILYEWYSKTYTAVKWGSQLSYRVPLLSGVRQGSVLAPI